MTKPIVLLDIDGVVGDFVGRYLDTVADITGHRFTHQDVTQFEIERCQFFLDCSAEHKRALGGEVLADAIHREICSPGWCRSIRPLPGAIDGVKALKKIARVHPVTSPWHDSPYWAHERYKWIEEYLEINPRDVVLTSTKTLINGDFLIDDRAANVYDWIESRMIPICKGMIWHQPWNTQCVQYDDANVFHVYNWDDVLENVRKVSQ